MTGSSFWVSDMSMIQNSTIKTQDRKLNDELNKAASSNHSSEKSIGLDDKSNGLQMKKKMKFLKKLILKQKLKIGIVCFPTYGGSGIVATELGRALAKKGHEIHFITYKQPVRLELLSNRIHFHEVHVPEYPLFHYQPYELALSSKLVDTVKFFGIELLHVHYAIPHAYAGYMAKKMLVLNLRTMIISKIANIKLKVKGNCPKTVSHI